MSALADDAPRGFVAMREYLKLQRRCDELEERVAQIDIAQRDRACEWARYADDHAMPLLRLGLKTRQGAILAAIIADMSTREILQRGLACSPVSLRSQICYVRKHLAARPDPPPRNWLTAKWRASYVISPEGRAWLKARVPEAFAQGAGR